VVVGHADYDSFGGTVGRSSGLAGERFAFMGREADGSSGLQYFRARYYEATVGRFVETDPKGFLAGDVNLFRFVGNRPTGRTDPQGTDFVTYAAVPALIGALFGAYNGCFGVSSHCTTDEVIQGFIRGGLIGGVGAILPFLLYVDIQIVIGAAILGGVVSAFQGQLNSAAFLDAIRQQLAEAGFGWLSPETAEALVKSIIGSLVGYPPR
jgi:RHS repeat-associated protein